MTYSGNPILRSVRLSFADVILAVAGRLAAAIENHRRAATYSRLREYDEYLLRDIGLTRSDLVARRPTGPSAGAAWPMIADRPADMVFALRKEAADA